MAASEGEVGIDVVADTSTFEAKLKAKLTELSKKLQAKINLQLNTIAAKASLAAFSAQARRERAIVRLATDSKIANIELSAFVRRASLKTIDISVRLSKASLAAATGQLKSLTGLNGIGNAISKFSGDFTSFFDNLPSVASSVAKFGSIASLAGTLIGSLFVTLNLLSSAGPGLVASLVALPGILLGVGLQAAVLIIALKNAPPAVKAAAAAYKGLSKVISTNFWAGAAKNATSFLNSIRSGVFDGFKSISQASGSFFGRFAADLQTSLGGGVITGIFNNTRNSIVAFGPASAPLASVIANLATFGTSLLPAISTYLAQIVTRFDAFVQAGIASGSFIAGFQQLKAVLDIVGNGISGLLGIIGGLGRAAANAGIGDLLSPLQQIAAVVNSPTFQVALTNLFSGAALGAKGLLTAIGPIGQLIANLSPIIEGFLVNLGATVGSLVTSLANALNRPEFRAGLSAFFSGILAFIQPLIPLMPIFAEKLGIIATFAGNLLSVLGPVFASLLSVIVPVLSQIFTAIQPLVDALGPVLTNVITALGPVFASLISAIQPIIGLVTSLLPPIMQVVDVVLGGLTPVFNSLVPIFNALIPPILSIVSVIVSALLPILGPLLQLLGAAATAILPYLAQALGVVAGAFQYIGPVLTLVGQIIGAVIQTIVDLFTGNFSGIATVWLGVWNGILDFYNNTVQPRFTEIGNFVMSVFNNIGAFFTNVFKAYITTIQGALGFISGIWNTGFNALKDVFVSVFQGIQNIEKGIFNGIMKGIAGFVNGAIDLINGIGGGLSAITALVGIKIGKIPHIALPQLALGATVLPRPGGTAAILGEGGKAESVVDTGKFNRLMDIVLNTFPKALAAVTNRGAGSGAIPVGGPAGNTYNTTNNFPVPDGMDPAEVAQQYVNRAAEKTGLAVA